MLPVPPPERLPFPIAEVAEDDLRRRRHLLDSLERVERALRRWDTWETNALLPADLKRPVLRSVHRDGLDALQRMLAEELARPDG